VQSPGFGAEVGQALNSRVEHLIGEGPAKREGQRMVFALDLRDTLRQRELEATAAQVASQARLPSHHVDEGETVAGVYRPARRQAMLAPTLQVVDRAM
jgi:Protein of unknown function (DUF3363)